MPLNKKTKRNEGPGLVVLSGSHVSVKKIGNNGPGDLGSIQGRVIPKTLIMVLDTTLFNTQ